MANNPLDRVKEKLKQRLDPEKAGETTKDTGTPSTTPSTGHRTGGKRSDPAWVMRSFFLRKDTDQAVKKAILELESQGITYDKSELMEDLLTGWLTWYQSGGSLDDYMKTRTPPVQPRG